MPASMLACRTVFPFSTVSCRPSIVSVTVSISARSYLTGPFGLAELDGTAARSYSPDSRDRDGRYARARFVAARMARGRRLHHRGAGNRLDAGSRLSYGQR